MRTLASFTLPLDGPGFVVYSPFAMSGVPAGAPFLADHYTEAEDVAASVRAGRLAGCCTGSPGTYQVSALEGELDTAMLVRYVWWIRLAVEVRDRTVCIRDLFDFARWDPSCPESQQLELDDGFYRLALGTRPTNSGIVGDDQDLAIVFERVDALPALTWTGVPFLGREES